MTFQFLYPTSSQYPIDGVCGDIVRALEARNFDVPNIHVEFRTYGSGEQKFRYVSCVTGDDFSVSYGRPQGLLPGGRWNDVAAASGIMIPRRRIEVYEDESGPSFWLYVGDDWPAHRERFKNYPGVNSKLNGDSRFYLRYRAVCRCGNAHYEHTHIGRRSPWLIADNDLGREYDPLPGEPLEFETAEILEEFRIYLCEALDTIESHPTSERIDLFPEQDSITVPVWAKSLFCFGDSCDVDRIQRGKKDPASLDAAYRYGMEGNGWRLCSFDVENDGTLPELAYKGFLWCGLPWADGSFSPTPPIPGNTRGTDNRYMINIRLNRANEIYIADHGSYEARREELIIEAKERSRVNGTAVPAYFTNAEISDFHRARARTLVPINEYKGGYSKPVILIRRELDFNEVEVLSECNNAVRAFGG